MTAKKRQNPIDKLQDKHIFLILASVCVISRLPFLRTFELVAYDGTYYLNQARTLFSGHMAGSFPLGYPFVVKIFQIVLRDYQTSGMAVSFVAGVGSAIVVFLLAKRFVRRDFAFLASVAVALNPLFIRLSLMTLSESLYVFWVLLGLLMFVDKKWVWFGLAMGMAAITRPEAIAIAGLLGVSRIRRPKQLTAIALSFLAVYALNSAVLSVNAGRAVILAKSEFFGSSTAFWKLREASIDFEGKDDTYREMVSESEGKSRWTDYFGRLSVEVRVVLRHVLPVIFLFALVAFRNRKYLFFSAALVSFFVIPLVTVRSQDRYILPYLPVLILLATLAIGDLRNKSVRAAGVALMVATILVLPVFNKAELLEAEEPELGPAKRAGLELRDQVGPEDKIADRKPFFAFYSGGDYVEIPVAPYEDVMTYLTENQRVRFLSLHQTTIHRLRPALRPLMYSRAVINGELRFRQTYFDPEGEMVFRRVLDADPLQWAPITPPGGADFAPAWSPDGTKIAFRSKTKDGVGGIYVIEARESRGLLPRKVTDAKAIYDQLSWSPDGKRIAFASDESGAMNIFAVDVESGGVTPIVSGTDSDMSPSWSPTGDEIVFSSDRTGQPEIWVVDPLTRDVKQITSDGDNTRPAVSPTGEMMAWIKQDRGVVVMHGPSGRLVTLRTPRRVRYAPAWSPDGQYLAVTAEDWGSWDIYLVKNDGTNALLLTKNPKRDAMPVWSPDGDRIALTSDRGQKTLSVWTIAGLQPYLERLESRERVQVFDASVVR